MVAVESVMVHEICTRWHSQDNLSVSGRRRTPIPAPMGEGFERALSKQPKLPGIQEFIAIGVVLALRLRFLEALVRFSAEEKTCVPCPGRRTAQCTQ